MSIAMSLAFMSLSAWVSLGTHDHFVLFCEGGLFMLMVDNILRRISGERR